MKENMDKEDRQEWYGANTAINDLVRRAREKDALVSDQIIESKQTELGTLKVEISNPNTNFIQP